MCKKPRGKGDLQSATLLTLLLLPWAASAQVSGVGATPPAVSEGRFSRWASLDQANFKSAYVNTTNTYGRRIIDGAQEQGAFEGRIKFDEGGRYFVGWHLSTGSNLGFSYGAIIKSDLASLILHNPFVPRKKSAQIATILMLDKNGSSQLEGAASSGWNFNLRNLYGSATPVQGVTFEYGALSPRRGAGSDITNYSDEQNILGARARFELPEYLWLDSLSGTFAYFGDETSPNVFARGGRFLQVNYRQVLLEKSFGKRAQTSLDYTLLARTHTLREAVRVGIAESRVADAISVELYQRLNSLQMPGYLARRNTGWAVTAIRTFRKRLTVQGGYADVDEDYGVYSGSSLLTVAAFPINGSVYQVGKRVFSLASWKVNDYVSFVGFYSREVDNARGPLYYTFNRQGLSGAISVDFAQVFSRNLKRF